MKDALHASGWSNTLIRRRRRLPRTAAPSLTPSENKLSFPSAPTASYPHERLDENCPPRIISQLSPPVPQARQTFTISCGPQTTPPDHPFPQCRLLNTQGCRQAVKAPDFDSGKAFADRGFESLHPRQLTVKICCDTYFHCIAAPPRQRQAEHNVPKKGALSWRTSLRLSANSPLMHKGFHEEPLTDSRFIKGE